MTLEKSSPFTPGNPVRAELFAGRHQQIQDVSNYLMQAASGRMENVFLTGERGIGKSSFASFTLQKARANNNMVGVHIFLGGVTTLEELVRKVIEELINEISDRSWYDTVSEFLGDYVRKVGVFGVTIEFRPPIENLSHIVGNFPDVLGGLLARISEHNDGVLIILDDINGLAETSLFANWYKSVVDHTATHFGAYPALIMLSGLPEKRDQLATQQPSLLRVFRALELGRLSDQEVEAFFENAFASADMNLTDEAMRVMVHFSSGLPIMMQEIGDATFWEDTDGTISEEDAISGVGRAALNIGRKYMNPSVYNALRSDRYQTIIRKLAIDSIQPSFTRQEVASRLTDEELGVFDNFLRRLRKLGVVELDPTGGRGSYRYTNQIFPVYMYAESQAFGQQ